MSRLCEDCDCEIPTGRLKAVPNARFCVECQEEAGDVFRTRAIISHNDEGDSEIGGFVKDRSSWSTIEAYSTTKKKRPK